MPKNRNKRKGSQREGNLINSLWDNGWILVHAPHSAGGYPTRIFREKYPTIYKANKDKPVKPIDFIGIHHKRKYLFQVSKYYDCISDWEIRVLLDLAEEIDGKAILGWKQKNKNDRHSKLWKFCEADTKIEFNPFDPKNIYETFCEKEGLIT